MCDCNKAARRRMLMVIAVIAALVAIIAPTMLFAQSTVYYACYVPSSGTVYRIKEPGLPTECGSSTKKGVTTTHISFSWSDAGNHGNLGGLANDDHPQYLLAGGNRTHPNGFAVSGELGVGSIPAVGAGVRLMWYPGKIALRAGSTGVDGWDDANIGLGSVALGIEAKASGPGAVALGRDTEASGQNSVALGRHSTASGFSSTALNGATAGAGYNALASGTGSVASGNNTVALGAFALASGSGSVALGKFSSTNGREGAFVYGDGSTNTYVSAAADNQFVVRASRFWLGSNNNVTATAGRFLETSTGAHLTSGGTWVNSSDVNRKEHFAVVDADDVLRRLEQMPIQTWSYRDEDASVRHIGPTAQDFRAAFGLGASETSIATVDADGVSLAAIQALARRATELRAENEALRHALTELRAEQDALRELLRSLGERIEQNARPGAHDHR